MQIEIVILENRSIYKEFTTEFIIKKCNNPQMSQAITLHWLIIMYHYCVFFLMFYVTLCNSR